MKAEVILHLGRWHLVVNGVYVAMEDDPCRDPAITGRHWTKAGLDVAAGLINTVEWESAADRMKRGAL